MSIQDDTVEAGRIDALMAELTEGDAEVGLQAVARLRSQIERLEAVLVRRARNDGATWEQIATTLGVSRQAVHKKHGGKRLLHREP